MSRCRAAIAKLPESQQVVSNGDRLAQNGKSKRGVFFVSLMFMFMLFRCSQLLHPRSCASLIVVVLLVVMLLSCLGRFRYCDAHFLLGFGTQVAISVHIPGRYFSFSTTILVDGHVGMPIVVRALSESLSRYP